MTLSTRDNQWPIIDGNAPVQVPTPSGDVFVQLARPFNSDVMIIVSQKAVEIPVVRFQSACVFGEGLRAIDCDCGAQMEAAIALICRDGGVMTYAWEEGRGLGIAEKLRAIALQQSQGIDTAEAFHQLGHPSEPRNFDNHVAALKLVFKGSKVKLASSNPAKIAALARGGIEVMERIVLDVPTTPEREEYLARKIPALGHHQ